jgi:hypothetical protein
MGIFSPRKKVNLGGGLSLNLSKSGASVSKKVGKVTLNSRGTASASVAKGLSIRVGKPKKRKKLF